MNDYNNDEMNSPFDERDEREEFEMSSRSRTDYNRDYDYGYYKREKPEKPKKSSGVKVVIIALVFAILGSLIGGAFGSKLANDRFEKELMANLENEMATSSGAITINTNDDINTVSAVAKANLPAVVGVTTKTIMQGFLNQQYAYEGVGSGFIVQEDGYILTNDHVVASLRSRSGYSEGVGYADEVTVILDDGTSHEGEVLWSNSQMDLALIKIETDKKLPTVTLGDSDNLSIGEPAIAIGNPLAIEFHGTVTAGYISGLDRSLSSGATTMEGLIQTDASINGGNSGGPLLNSKGEVIGVNTMKISSSEGMGFAIPINQAKVAIEQVIATGSYEKVTIGIIAEPAANFEMRQGVELGIDEGIVIYQVLANSPAQKAGLRFGDVILSIDGNEVNEMSEIRKELYNYNYGDTATLEVYRDGEAQEIEITFEEYE